MILYPRQEVFVDRMLAGLRDGKNPLGVAPTGSGKTVMMAALVSRFGGRCLVLQHRNELLGQNMATFLDVDPHTPVSEWSASRKSWSDGTTFAMEPTLRRDVSLRAMPGFDLVLIDEAHHAGSDSYRRICDVARERNPKVLFAGVTATPIRSDRRNLRMAFDLVADHISLAEMINLGRLVPPRYFVASTGNDDEVRDIKLLQTGDYDHAKVGLAMSEDVVLAKVLAEWREKAGTRQTVVFCSSQEHAVLTLGTFLDAGMSARMVVDSTPPKERARAFAAMLDGECQVLVNVMVATEGWDCPPVSCVVVLRKSAFLSTLVQMIGRGLRTINPEKFPLVQKSDCVVLDFGQSILEHGGIEVVVSLGDEETIEPGVPPCKSCPECGAAVPTATRECSICGHVFDVKAKEGDASGTFGMVEVDPLTSAIWPWHWYNARTVVCSLPPPPQGGSGCWAIVTQWSDGQWKALVSGTRGMELVREGEHGTCVLAAGSWLNEHARRSQVGDANKMARSGPSQGQIEYLAKLGKEVAQNDFTFSKYAASCAITLLRQRSNILNYLRAHEVRKGKAVCQ